MGEAGWKAGESGANNNWENGGGENEMRPKRERETRVIRQQSVAAPSPM